MDDLIHSIVGSWIISIELTRWAVDHAREILPEFLGGFVAYILHTLYHEVWKRPTHFLARRVFRRRKGGK